jgi:hypothetical protein
MYFSVQDTSGCVKARYVMAFMGFLGFANVYAMRVNLSVAIVAMVNNTAIPKVNDSESNDECAVEFTNRTTVQVGHNVVFLFIHSFHAFIRVCTCVSHYTVCSIFLCVYLSLFHFSVPLCKLHTSF